MMHCSWSEMLVSSLSMARLNEGTQTRPSAVESRLCECAGGDAVQDREMTYQAQRGERSLSKQGPEQRRPLVIRMRQRCS